MAAPREEAATRSSAPGLVLAAAAVLAVLGVQVALATGTNGISAETAAVSKKKFKKLKQRVAAVEGRTVPADAVAFFNRSSCPSGWSELTAAQGRYIVGVPSGGTLAATTGVALANQENRAVGQHSHGVTDPGHTHATDIPLGDVDVVFPGATGIDTATAEPPGVNIPTQLATTGISIQQSGAVAGTNAPYLQLLACQKS